MKSSFALVTYLAVLVSSAVAEVGVYGQCGGQNYKGDTVCVRGTVCTTTDEARSQCSPIPTIRANNLLDGYAAYGFTTGGASGSTVHVSTLAALKSAVAGNSNKIVVLTASLNGNEVIRIGSNTSLMGANSGITLNGIGLRVLGVSNVIIQNIKISKVLASAGDAIGVQAASRVWIDHVDLSSDMAHDKDYYDGLIDITHGCINVTVSWSYFHDHWKSSLIGAQDSDGSEDKYTTVTYHHNHFTHVNSRTPSIRFGTGHFYNNYFDNVNLGIDTRDGAQLLVENNVFVNTTHPLYATNNGYAVAKGNDFGGAKNEAPTGSLTSVPYDYSLSSTSSVKSGVPSGAGAKLQF